MQPLIRPILSQIIDSCFYFPERFRDFSCWKYPQELQLLHLKTSYHLNWVFGQKFTRNAKNGFECLKLVWSGTFAIFNTEPLWFWSRIGSRVNISHYIQPSNLSSALQGTRPCHSQPSMKKIIKFTRFNNYIIKCKLANCTIIITYKL